jgi:hypothetical protein
MLILVFIINLATLNCHDSKDAILALEHGIQTAQPWGIGGRKIYFHIASPKEIHVHLTVLLYNYTFLKIFFEITVYVVAKTQRSDHQMKINVIERISNRKYTYTKGHKNNLLILECDWMKHFILKNEITITLIKKKGGWKFQLWMLFVFKLNILPKWREYPMTYFIKQKTLRT